MTLSDHLRGGAARPFAWGGCDCVLWACDWVALRRGVDPAAPFRGRYRTARGAARRLARGGGLLALARERMAAAGLPATDAPQPGDVGVVALPEGDALALRTPTGWAVKGPHNIVVTASRPVRAAWRV